MRQNLLLIIIGLVLTYFSGVSHSEAQRGPRSYYSDGYTAPRQTRAQPVRPESFSPPPPVETGQETEGSEGLDDLPELQSDDNPCRCPTNNNPVCGEDGVTYQNSCFAYCSAMPIVKHISCEQWEEQKEKALKKRQDELAKQCICTQEYDPVCSTRGVTYSNPCLAQCVNAKIAYTGHCGSSNDDRDLEEKLQDAGENAVVDKLF